MAANIPAQPAGPAVAAHRSLKPDQSSGRLSGFGNMFRKEMGDWFHTRRWMTQLLLWVGIINVFMAFVLFAAPKMSPQGAETPPANELSQMGMELFFSFMVTGGTIGVVIIAMDEVVGERLTGTAAWILSKPVSRTSFILTKLVANAIGITVFIAAIPGLIAYFEIWLASGKPPDPVLFLLGICIGLLALLFYLTFSLMLGVLYNKRGAVIGTGLGLFFGGSILVNLTQVIALVLPVAMQNFASNLARGISVPSAGQVEILVTTLWCVVFTAIAIWRFEQLEM